MALTGVTWAVDLVRAPHFTGSLYPPSVLMERSNIFSFWKQDLPASVVVFLVALPLS